VNPCGCYAFITPAVAGRFQRLEKGRRPRRVDSSSRGSTELSTESHLSSPRWHSRGRGGRRASRGWGSRAKMDALPACVLRPTLRRMLGTTLECLDCGMGSPMPRAAHLCVLPGDHAYSFTSPDTDCVTTSTTSQADVLSVRSLLHPSERSMNFPALLGTTPFVVSRISDLQLCSRLLPRSYESIHRGWLPCPSPRVPVAARHALVDRIPICPKGASRDIRRVIGTVLGRATATFTSADGPQLFANLTPCCPGPGRGGSKKC